MSDNQTDNLWERAQNPEELVFQYWGVLYIRPWECALVSGVGKVPYDPAIHQRSTLSVEARLDPLPELQLTFDISRDEVSFGKEHKLFLKSIHDAGIPHIAQANGQWCRCSFQKTGEQYERKDPQTKQPTGVMQDKTYLHIEQFFGSEEECREDYFKVKNGAGVEPVDSNTTDAGFPHFESMRAFLDVVISESMAEEDGRIVYENLLGWFDMPQYQALKPIYGADVPGAKEFVSKVIDEKYGV